MGANMRPKIWARTFGTKEAIARSGRNFTSSCRAWGVARSMPMLRLGFLPRPCQGRTATETPSTIQGRISGRAYSPRDRGSVRAISKRSSSHVI